jgi:adenylate cyclase
MVEKRRAPQKRKDARPRRKPAPAPAGRAHRKPARAAPPRRSPPARRRAGAGPPLAHVLLVDDDEALLASLQAYLQSSLPRMKVLTATSGPAALAILKDVAVDVALIDYRMDEMNGLQVLRTVRQESPATARILMTAYPAMQLAMDALNQANARFLAKPLQPAQVLRVVLDALGKRADGLDG